MWRLIIYVLLLIASVWIGLVVVKHPGYLLIMYQPWMVQIPIWLAAFAALIIFILFYLLISSIDRLHLLWYRFKNWLRFRREHISYSKTQQGLAALIEGHWQQAENLFVAGMSQSGDPLVNYLGCAKAAHERKEYEKRDDYIRKAYKTAPNANLAIGLVQTEFALEQDKLEQATATLNNLRQTEPKHPRVLKLLEKTYIRLGDWQHLLAILPNLYKAKVITKEQYEQFEKNIYYELLQSPHIKDKYDLDKIWYEAPKSVKKNSVVSCAYVKQLMRFPKTEKEQEEIIRKTLKTSFNPELVNIYSHLPFDNINRQLSLAASWLKLYGSRPELLLLLGKLCVRAQLWGKAKDYFERCLSIEPNPDCALQYGNLLEQFGESDVAIKVYRECLTQEVMNTRPRELAT